MAEETAQVRLDAFLAACAKESDLREGVYPLSHRAFQAACADDEELAGLVKEKLKQIDPGVLRRDHLSRWLKATLEGALPK